MRTEIDHYADVIPREPNAFHDIVASISCDDYWLAIALSSDLMLIRIGLDGGEAGVTVTLLNWRPEGEPH